MGFIAVEIKLLGLQRMAKKLTNLDMKKIGEEAFKLNSEQIQAKKDHKGRRFKRYTKAYAKRKGVGMGDVDLTSKARGLSKKQKEKPYGTMRKNYNIVRIERYKVTLGFSNTWDKQKAEWNISGGRSPSRARKFVGLYKANRKKLIDFAKRLIFKKY